MKALLLLVIMVILVPMAFLAPFTGVLTYLWLALFRPHEWAYTPASQYSLAVGTATLLGYLIFEFGRRPPKLLPNLWMILLWAQISLAVVFGVSTDNSMLKYIEFTKVFVIGLLVSALVDSESRTRWLLAVVLGSVGMLAFRSAFAIVVRFGNTNVQGPGGTFEDNNNYALLLNMALPLFVYFARGERQWWLRWGGYALAGMAALAVVFTGSRGGFLGLCTVLTVMVLKSRHKLLAGGLAAAAALTFFSLAPERIINRLGTIKEVRNEETREASAQQRIRAWGESLEIIRDHPALGVGVSNMLLVLPRYGNEDASEQRVSHNSYLQVAVDAGLPALALFVLMLGVTFLRLRKLRRLLRAHAPSDRLINYAHGIEAGLAGYVVSATFLSLYAQELLFVYVPLVNSLIVLARAYEQEAQVCEVVSSATASAPDRGQLAPVGGRESGVGRAERPAPGYGLPAPDFRLPTSDFRLPK
jgi:probable O-glycosylation ligase (exosortase A-associated)